MLANPALASGGPHLVDDAGTVLIGSCELESYGSVTGGNGRGVVSPTCAVRWLGDFEVGVIAAIETPGAHVIPGIAAKTRLGHIGRFRFAAELSGGYDPEGNQLNYISSNVPIDIETFDWLELHANAGLDFEPGAKPIPTWGLAALVEPLPHFQLVAETAKREGFRSRQQFGLRFQNGNLVFDVLYSHNLDEQNPGGWLTLGLTWAFRIDRRRAGDRTD